MILKGHVLDVLRDMESDSVDLVVTSPPYYGHRSYPVPDVVWGGDTNCDHEWSNTIDRVQGVGGNDGVPEDWQRQGRESNTQGNAGNFCTKCWAWKGQLGLEPDLKLYVEHIGMVLSELKRVIKPTGSIFLNLGDSYNTVSGSGKIYGNLGVDEDKYNISWFKKNIIGTQKIPRKSLMNIPSRVAIMATDKLGLSERNDIAWVKPNGLPGGWADRLTVRKEVIYHFVKRSKYYYNLDNIREPYSDASIKRAQSPLLHDKEAYMGQLPSMNRWYGKIKKKHDGSKYNDKQYTSINERKNAERDRSRMLAETYFPDDEATQQAYINYAHDHGVPAADKYFDMSDDVIGKNPSDVWTMSTESIHENHIAPYPRKLVARIVAAACPPNGTVLDPFAGSGTIGVVAEAFNHKKYDDISKLDTVVNMDVFRYIEYNLNWIGIEFSEDYVDIANKRIRRVWNPDQSLLTSEKWLDEQYTEII